MNGLGFFNQGGIWGGGGGEGGIKTPQHGKKTGLRKKIFSPIIPPTHIKKNFV